MTKKQKDVQRIAQYRGLPFVYLGMLVSYYGTFGTITGIHEGAGFKIKLINEREGCYHPYTEGLKYFNKRGILLADFSIKRSQEELDRYLEHFRCIGDLDDLIQPMNYNDIYSETWSAR